MEYQKIVNSLDDTSNKLSKFTTRNWAEINDASRLTYNTNNDIRFKTSMIRSNLCPYSDAYIHVKYNYIKCNYNSLKHSSSYWTYK